MSDRHLGHDTEDLIRKLLVEITALRGEVHALRAEINGQGRDAGLWEIARELQRDRDAHDREMDELRARLDVLERAPGKVALRWADAVAIALLVASAVGVGALVVHLH